MALEKQSLRLNALHSRSREVLQERFERSAALIEASRSIRAKAGALRAQTWSHITRSSRATGRPIDSER